MSLLAPWALWFATVGAAIVGLYLLRIRRQRQTVPALDFWLQLAGRTKVHSLFDRLKRLLSMLLWLLILACMVVALGNPILSWGAVKPQSIAVIIDNSASMQAIEESDGGVTRLDLAKRALGELTSRRPVTDRWLLIDAQREPRVVAPWSHDRREIVRAAEAIRPFAGRGDLAAAIELASQLLDGKPEPLIVVLSDGAGTRLGERAAKEERVVPWPIGAVRDNLGIAALRVRFHPQLLNHHVLLTVVNAGQESVDTSLTLTVDGRTHGVELVHVEAGGRWERTLVIDAPSGGVLRAEIDRPDALAFDNEAHAILHAVRPAKVWLVSPPNEAFFFEQALTAMDPLIDAAASVTMSVEEYVAARAELAAMGEAAARKAPDLVLFNNVVPSGTLGPGRFIVMNALPEDVAAKDLGPIEAPQMFLAPREHPLTQYLSLNGVRMAEARRLRLSAPATVLASSAEGDPLVLLSDAPGRQTLLLAFDVLRTDLPFRNAFPLLLRNAVAYLHTEAPSWLKDEYALGESIIPLRSFDAKVSEATLTLVHGGANLNANLHAGESHPERSVVPVVGGRFTHRAARTGALRVDAGEASAFAAINLCDESESRIAVEADALGDPTARLALSRTLFGSMPWVAFASLALLLIALEWMTYSFRWTE